MKKGWRIGTYLLLGLGALFLLFGFSAFYGSGFTRSGGRAFLHAIFYALPVAGAGIAIRTFSGPVTNPNNEPVPRSPARLVTADIVVAITIVSMIGLWQHFQRERAWMPADPMGWWDGVPIGCPINVSFQSTTNEPDGTRVATFILTNRSSRKVTFIADDTGRPCYALLEVKWFQRAGTTNSSFRITNHNLQHFVTGAKESPLNRGTSITFPVRIGPRITNETIIISYRPRQPRIVELANEVAELLRLKRSGVFHNYPIREPFGKDAKP